MTERTPIKPEDIREGDLIRWESSDSEEAHEFRRGRSPKPVARHGQHYLLDRPVPKVDLPTEPTLGWASGETRHGTYVNAALGSWAVGKDEVMLNRTDYTWPEPEGPLHLPSEKVTGFTPATAVPTAALDELRNYRDGFGDDPATVAVRRIDKFLAAVDKAGEPND